MSPPALESRPVLHEWMKEYLSAFYTLNSTRQYGLGPCPISLTEMATYMQIYGASDPGLFIEYVMLMDEAFLKIKAEIAEQNKGKGDGQRSGDGR